MTPEINDSVRVPPSHTWLATGLIVIGTIVPLALYWFLLGGSDCVSPEWARQQLRAGPEEYRLVDVRGAEAFAAGHVESAVHWPLDKILAAGSPQQVPDALRGKSLLLVCEVGTDSRTAARHLAGIGIAARFVRGGLQEWLQSGRRETPDQVVAWHDAAGRQPAGLARQSPRHEQALAVLAYFIVKPIYTILALAAAIVLWTSRSPDLAALRWSMIFFFIGENACAVNYFAFEERSYLLEFMHSMGMLLTFAFAAYAALDGIDRRIILLSDPHRRCAALWLCGRCVKQADVPCGLRRMFCVLLPAALFVSMVLPTADWKHATYVTKIFDVPFVYRHLHVYQVFENQYCGFAAAALFACSWIVLLAHKQAGIAPAKILFAAGLGPLGFGGLRMLLGAAYDQNRVWYLFWEEGTELAFVASVCAALWIFHRRLPLWVNQIGETTNAA